MRYQTRANLDVFVVLGGGGSKGLDLKDEGMDVSMIRSREVLLSTDTRVPMAGVTPSKTTNHRVCLSHLHIVIKRAEAVVAASAASVAASARHCHGTRGSACRGGWCACGEHRADIEM